VPSRTQTPTCKDWQCLASLQMRRLQWRIHLRVRMCMCVSGGSEHRRKSAHVHGCRCEDKRTAVPGRCSVCHHDLSPPATGHCISRAPLLPPHTCIFVWGSPPHPSAGVRAAVAAGLAVVGIASGHSPETLRAAGCCLVLPDFHGLVSLALEQSEESPAAVISLCGKAFGGSGTPVVLAADARSK
jgi:hypothetical protein